MLLPSSRRGNSNGANMQLIDRLVVDQTPLSPFQMQISLAALEVGAPYPWSGPLPSYSVFNLTARASSFPCANTPDRER
jgi:hypothetical protein